MLRAPLLAAALLCMPYGMLMAQGGTLPVLHSGGRTDVLIHSSLLDDAAAANRLLGGLVQSCRAALPISAGDSASVAQLALPPAAAVPSQGSTITLSLLPVDALQPSCDKNPVLGTLAASRGLRITFDTSRAEARSVTTARVLRNGSEVEPLAVQRLPILRLGASGLVQTSQTWVRLTLPLDAFAFPPSGDDPGFEVFIETGTGGAVDRVRVPGSTVRAVWRQLLPSRAATLRGSAMPALELPAPDDATLRQADEAFRRGDAAAAVQALSTRLRADDGLTRGDRRYAHAAGALAFEALGDRRAANVLLADLVQLEPCFAFGPGAPAATVEALRALQRPAARCSARSSLRTAAQSLLLPGFGRPMEPGRLLTRSLIGASVLVTSALAFQHNEDAKSSYDSYLRWRYYPDVTGAGNPAVDLYNQAESSRQSALSMYRLSAALYLGQAAYAVWAERRHGARLNEVNSYGRAPRQARLVPVGRDGSLGLAFTLTW
ncbi:MAG: hypothetical protein C0503_00520 [Gemmatimonas sp.]|nr:hypothetical protein [Gemmatimonas sp.]